MLVKLDDSNWVDAASVRRVHSTDYMPSGSQAHVYVTTSEGTEHWCGTFDAIAEAAIAAARLATQINRALDSNSQTGDIRWDPIKATWIGKGMRP